MARENARAKATRYLVEGRVVVTHLDGDELTAHVRGDGRLWHVHHRGSRWMCDCPAKGRCAHLLAVGLVVAVRSAG